MIDRRCPILFFVMLAGCCDGGSRPAQRPTDGVEPRVAALVRQMEREAGPRSAWNSFHALQSMGPAALPALKQLTRSKEAVLRRGAARAFAALGASAEALMPQLLGLLGDADREVRFTTIHALPRLRGPYGGAVKALRGRLRDGAQKVREAAVEVLVRLAPKQAADWFRQDLGQRDPGVRATAIRGLGLLGPPALPVLNQITTATHDPDRIVRYEAFDTLVRLGPSAAAAIPALTGRIDDQRATVRLGAIRALGSVATTQAPAAVALGKGLTDSDERVRDAAGAALASMGAAAAPASAALVKALDDKSHHTRAAAAQALGAIGAMDAIKPLTGRLDDTRFDVVLAAGEALGHIATAHPAAIAVLRRALSSTRPQTREGAVVGVGAMGQQGAWARTRLKKLADGDDSVSVRKSATRALAAIGPG